MIPEAALAHLGFKFFEAMTLAGKSKRVPDRDDPGRKGFDRLREVLVNHGRSVASPASQWQTSVPWFTLRRIWHGQVIGPFGSAEKGGWAKHG